MSAISIDRVRELNDSFRTSFVGGAIMITRGVDCLEPEVKSRLLAMVRDFKDFEEGDDPYSEHDFGAVTVNGSRYFFKIDYYDTAMEQASPNPGDPAVTRRVLTIMNASEY